MKNANQGLKQKISILEIAPFVCVLKCSIVNPEYGN